jgi:hypothetical protein
MNIQHDDILNTICIMTIPYSIFNTILNAMAYPAHTTFVNCSQPYMEVTLYPGDVLYVPRGTIHATSTSTGDGDKGAGGDVGGDVTSVHMTTNVVALLVCVKVLVLTHLLTHSFIS